MDTIAIAWIQINLTYKGKEDTELHKKNHSKLISALVALEVVLE